LQPPGIAVAAQEPQQLEDDRLQVHLLRRHQREAFVQVEAHLVAEDALGAGAGAVGLGHAMHGDVAHEVFVLAADRVQDEVSQDCLSGRMKVRYRSENKPSRSMRAL
jgi:hypothetical protein